VAVRDLITGRLPLNGVGIDAGGSGIKVTIVA